MRDRASGPAKGELDLIHPSLTKPVLWAGVERRIVGLEFMIVVLVVTWRGMTPTALLLIGCIVIPMHLVARRVAREDPRMFDLVLRSLSWHRHYPAHGSYRTAAPHNVSSIPRRR